MRHWRQPGARVLALALLVTSLVACGDLDKAADKKEVACKSSGAIAALKRHVLQTAMGSDSRAGIVGDLGNILRYQAENGPEDFRSSFQSALGELQQVSRSLNPATELVALNVSDIVERGLSETGESQCWARVQADLPATAVMPVSDMSQLLTGSYGWDPGSLAESVSIELFYTVQGGSRPSIVESDLSPADAVSVGKLGYLVQVAPVFLRPFEAMRKAEDARERELAAAKSRVIEITLSEARLAYAQSDAALNAAWRNLAESQRKSLAPQQRQWLRSREARCDLMGKEYSGDATESEIVKLQCMAQANIARTNALGG